MGFAAEDGTLIYKNGWKMLRWMIKKGSAQFSIEKHDYRIYVDGQLSDKMHSKLVIEPLGGGESKTLFTVEQLAEAAYLAGYPVRIGGTEFRLLYSENMNEGSDGEFSGFTGDRSIVLLRRENGKLVGLHWFERELPLNGVMVGTPRSAHSGDCDKPAQAVPVFGLGLSAARELRVFYPVDPSLASR
jgi:hypothetical protein